MTILAVAVRVPPITLMMKIPAGFSIEIQNLKFVGGSADNGSVIDNLGNLILRDCNLFRAIGSSSNVLRNTGTVDIFGNCDIRN